MLSGMPSIPEQQTAAPAALPRVAYTINEGAAAMGKSRRHVAELCATGALASFRSGRSRLIEPEAITAYIAAQKAREQYRVDA